MCQNGRTLATHRLDSIATGKQSRKVSRDVVVIRQRVLEEGVERRTKVFGADGLNIAILQVYQVSVHAVRDAKGR